MKTSITNNGSFTVRKRQFIYKGFICTLTIQHSSFYKKIYFSAKYKSDSPTSFGNLSKKSLINYVNHWLSLNEKVIQ